MSYPTYFTRIARATVVALGECTFICASIGILLGTAATAQADGNASSTDPFEMLRTNHGEAMMSQNPDWNAHFDYSPSSTFYPLLFGQSMLNPAFFPPPPPALGETLSPANAHVPETAHLQQLADFPGETFYMAYANLLRRKVLSEKRMQRIGEYRTARGRLVDELRASLDELDDKPPADRTAALTLLATRQDASLRALDSEAGAIRHDLTSGSLFTTSDSGENLDVLIADPRVNLSEAQHEFVTQLEAAQYFAGFSTDQRFLLEEMAFEARDHDIADGKPQKSAPASYVYFLPATARIRLPENLPAALDAKVQRFITEKERLKTELRDALKHPYYFLIHQRTRQFTQLAYQQAPQFTALENLAEAIRTELASLPYPDKPGGSTLPEDLTSRVGAFGTRRAALQREVFQHLRDFHAALPSARFEIVHQGAGLAIMLADGKGTAPATLAAVNADLARRYTALNSEADALRLDIQRYAETDAHLGNRTVDQLAGDFRRAYTEQENWNRYRDYYRAVLEPGLSPGQRRLLFTAVLSDFAHAGYLSSP